MVRLCTVLSFTPCYGTPLERAEELSEFRTIHPLLLHGLCSQVQDKNLTIRTTVAARKASRPEDLIGLCPALSLRPAHSQYLSRSSERSRLEYWHYM